MVLSEGCSTTNSLKTLMRKISEKNRNVLSLTYIGGDWRGARAKHIWKEGSVPKFFFFLWLEEHIVRNIPHKNKAKTQKSVYVTFHLFLYSMFSNLLLKKKKDDIPWRFHASEENFRRNRRTYLRLSFFHMSCFLRVPKNWKVICGSYEEKKFFQLLRTILDTKSMLSGEVTRHSSCTEQTELWKKTLKISENIENILTVN